MVVSLNAPSDLSNIYFSFTRGNLSDVARSDTGQSQFEMVAVVENVAATVDRLFVGVGVGVVALRRQLLLQLPDVVFQRRHPVFQTVGGLLQGKKYNFSMVRFYQGCMNSL